MKNWKLIFGLLLLTSYQSSAGCDSIPKDRIVLLNSDKLFKSYEATRIVQSTFDSISTCGERVMGDLKNNHSRNYKKHLMNSFGPNGIMLKANSYLTKPIIDTINLELKRYFDETQLSLIIDIKDTAVDFATEKFEMERLTRAETKKILKKYCIEDLAKYQDITEKVTQLLNQKFKLQMFVDTLANKRYKDSIVTILRNYK